MLRNRLSSQFCVAQIFVKDRQTDQGTHPLIVRESLSKRLKSERKEWGERDVFFMEAESENSAWERWVRGSRGCSL